ncbi:MAG: DNA pilot protein [Arizlama microvirus]|nr:MAG: DNA pilot protein [Arizlama microvirus]
MGILDSLGSFNPINWIADIGSSFIQDQLQDSNAKDQFNRQDYFTQDAWNKSKEGYQSRYQWTMDDMEKAGLNPIMAASSGFQVGAGPSQNTATAMQAAPVTVNPYSTSAKNQAETSKITEETKKVGVDADKAVAETHEAYSRILKNREETKVATQQERVLVQTMFNMEQDFLLKVKSFQKMDAEIGHMIADTNLKKEQQTKINYEKNVLVQQAREIKAQADHLAKIADVYNGPGGSVLAYIESIMKALNIGIGVGAYGRIGGK